MARAQGKGNIFTTDLALAVLQAAPRSVVSWDIIVQKTGGCLYLGWFLKTLPLPCARALPSARLVRAECREGVGPLSVGHGGRARDAYMWRDSCAYMWRNGCAYIPSWNSLCIRCVDDSIRCRLSLGRLAARGGRCS